MSEPQKYIDKLCPDGVEYKMLGDIAINHDRKRKAVTKGKRKTGIYPYYGASGIVDYVSDYIFDGDYLLVSEDGANLLARNTPIAFSISGKNWVNNHAHVLSFPTKTAQKYVEIYLNSINLSKYISGGAQPKLNQDNLNRVIIPIPTLAVQEEIVAILDDFTALISNLQTELELREKELEYYRDELLTFGDDVPIWNLSKCCITVSDGDHQPPPKVNTGIPFITISNITSNNQIDFNETKFVPQSYYNNLDIKRKATKDDILYTVVGSFGIPVYINSNYKFVFQRHIAILRPNKENIIPKYLYYTMQSSAFYKQADSAAKGAAQRTISLLSLNKMTVPIPPMEEQQRIVNILDEHNALCDNIRKEIELRQKEFEYYRDELLNFKDISAI